MNRCLRICVLCILSTIQLHSQTARCQNTFAQPKGFLQEEVLKAKAAGRTTVYIHPRNNDDGADDSVADMLRLFHVVVVTPIDSAVYRDGNTINTWYKVRVIETLSATGKCTACTSALAPPPSLLPVTKTDLLVPFFGGTTTINGVRVTMSDDSPVRLNRGEKYVLFVDPYPNQTAIVGAQAAGAYLLREDSSLEPFGQPTRNLKLEMLGHHNLAGLKSHIQNTQGTQK